MLVHRNGRTAAVMFEGPGFRFYRLEVPACVWVEVESLEAALAV
jgi:hypothetical protein